MKDVQPENKIITDPIVTTHAVVAATA